jgi:hypothetical protein
LAFFQPKRRIAPTAAETPALTAAEMPVKIAAKADGIVSSNQKLK